MHLLSILPLAAAFASVTAVEADPPPQFNLNLKYDETADWYKAHGMPVPEVASEITVIAPNSSYVVKLECPDCPFLVKDGENDVWLKRDNSLLLEFDIRDDRSEISTMELNGGQVLPLATMPLFINAYQVAANISQEAMDSIVREGMLDPQVIEQTNYHQFPLQYEHTLLKTKTPGQWWLQFDVTGLHYGRNGEVASFDEDRRIVQILVKEQKVESEEGHSLIIEDIHIVERYMRAQPLKMKCGKMAAVKTSFNPSEWDSYGKLGSWSRTWNMFSVRMGQYWLDNIQHNALLLPLVLLLAFIIFFVHVWYQRRQQDKDMDAEYALLESEQDDLPPAYSDIPVIKIEEYD
ncbi:hypothetical protein C7974DRAFT_397042 [Boeremia exigua]|uniref:uncharacterized protein n=1 Tax=Boeremia exigua TaxID=749465 RepID=UPI001E8CBEF0|nr:uncharacterized protein C7974DRAFT_397042 [Boeremia exigua]KAH6621733.1 hypothetical protein C7974DRAFT_397042 [Boeremia exigua]